jgi:hypothetical protein
VGGDADLPVGVLNVAVGDLQGPIEGTPASRMWEAIYEELESFEVRPRKPIALGDRLLTKM